MFRLTYYPSAHRVLLIAASVCACTKWQVQSVSPQRILSERQPDKIRVSRANGKNVVLNRPQIVGDSLYGLRSPSTGTPTTDGREAVTLGEIDSIAIRKSNPLGTAALVAAGAGVGLLILYIASAPET